MNLATANLTNLQIPVPSERRAGRRFPIEQGVSYKVRTGKGLKLGSGRTLDISSGGVLFTTMDNLEPGDLVEIAVAWPALLDAHCHLKLVIAGSVVRTGPGVAAIAKARHEFRTQGTNGLAALGKAL
jgi:hypothetical protein